MLFSGPTNYFQIQVRSTSDPLSFTVVGNGWFSTENLLEPLHWLFPVPRILFRNGSTSFWSSCRTLQSEPFKAAAWPHPYSWSPLLFFFFQLLTYYMMYFKFYCMISHIKMWTCHESMDFSFVVIVCFIHWYMPSSWYNRYSTNICWINEWLKLEDNYIHSWLFSSPGQITVCFHLFSMELPFNTLRSYWIESQFSIPLSLQPHVGFTVKHLHIISFTVAINYSRIRAIYSKRNESF